MLLDATGLVDLADVELRAGELACRPAGHDHRHDHDNDHDRGHDGDPGHGH